MALAAKGVTYQRCEVDLGKKTKWHLDINGGFVPVWETPEGDIITESKVIMELIEDAYPKQGYSMLPEDPVKRAQMRVAINLIDPLNAAWYPIYFKKSIDEADVKNLHEKMQKIEDFIAANKKEGSPFAMGTENPTQLDAHLYVHLERINMMKGTVWNDWWVMINFEKFPHIVKMLQGVRARPEFKGILANSKPWAEFVAHIASLGPSVRGHLYLPISNDE
jgi:glutathione S-transferase